VKRRGFDKETLTRLAVWKARSRVKPLVERNSEANIRMVTAFAFGIHDERMKIRILCCLDGVSIPMASAILTAWDPESYGIIDVYAWRACSGENRAPTEDNWIAYLNEIRMMAARHHKTPRQIDMALVTYGQPTSGE